jgi:hypothetical protein
MMDQPNIQEQIQIPSGAIKYKHVEHIIQNALHGKIKSDSILCADCGNKLSKEIDADFVSLFDYFIQGLKQKMISRDHGQVASKCLKGSVFEDETFTESKPVIVKEGKASPIDPFFEIDEESKTIFIFAHEKRAKQYINVVKKTLIEKGQNPDLYKFEVIEDISEKGFLGVFFTEGVQDFNKKIKLGLVKIAIGYASKCGISRDQMPVVLSIQPNGQGSINY